MPWDFSRRAIASSIGSSCLHGPHHDAHTSSSSTRPRYDATSILLPLSDSTRSAGTGAPTWLPASLPEPPPPRPAPDSVAHAARAQTAKAASRMMRGPSPLPGARKLNPLWRL